MNLQAVYQKHTLQFKFEAGTSRGILTEKTVYYIKIYDKNRTAIFGIGEAAPLQKLSPDDVPDFEQNLQSVCEVFNKFDLEVYPFNLHIILNQIISTNFPSIIFGFETALLDYMNGGKRLIFDNDFVKGKQEISINGLIWMDKKEVMLAQIDEKIAAGYTTIKVKIGALDFEEELACLAHIRANYSPEKITIRVDANGAFSLSDAPEKLVQLADYQLHSIEQPIAQGQKEAMTELCRTSPIAIALDEELIGVSDYFQKINLLKKIKPQYIILKPTLLGGFQHCREWIEIANRQNIGWWITSALESNIGLNAIAQFAAQFSNLLPQGLGTGQLFHNNIESPLMIKNGFLRYDVHKDWENIIS